MASTKPRYDCDCMKLLYAWFPPYHTWHEGKNQMWSQWLFSWSKDFFVKSVFANNKEITVQALLHCLPISNWDRKTGSCQDVTDYVVEDGTCIEVDFGGQVAHSWKVVLAWICYRSRPFCGPFSLVIPCGTLAYGVINCSRFLVIIFPQSWGNTANYTTTRCSTQDN